MIVKIQKPLNDPTADLLIYSRDRQACHVLLPQAEAPAAVLISLARWPKRYWHAEFVDGRLTFLKPATTQAW